MQELLRYANQGVQTDKIVWDVTRMTAYIVPWKTSLACFVIDGIKGFSVEVSICIGKDCQETIFYIHTPHTATHTGMSPKKQKEHLAGLKDMICKNFPNGWHIKILQDKNVYL